MHLSFTSCLYSVPTWSFTIEICRLAKLVLVMPATNAVSERCFSAMRRLKTYLRSSMGQSRLNHIMILSTYKEVDYINIDLQVLGDEFVRGSKHRYNILESSLVRTE